VRQISARYRSLNLNPRADGYATVQFPTATFFAQKLDAGIGG
jgi:hypothetical protein